MQKSSTLKSIIYNTSNRCHIIPLLILDEKFILPYIAHVYIRRGVLWSTESHPLLFQNNKIILLLEGSKTASTDCHLKIKYTELVAKKNFNSAHCIQAAAF